MASYYTMTVDGVAHPDAAWSYRRPTPLAGRVRGRVAFWGEVEVRVEPRSADDGEPVGDGAVGHRAQQRMRP